MSRRHDTEEESAAQASLRTSRSVRRGSLIAFLLGVAAMTYVQWSTYEPAGRDSFYHIKMAALLPEHGLVKTFPWLEFTYFTDEGDAFVSHHYGFHAMLVPFVKLSQRRFCFGQPGHLCPNFPDFDHQIAYVRYTITNIKH